MHQANLFEDSEINPRISKSPILSYKIYPGFLTTNIADTLFQELLESKHWNQQNVVIYGRRLLTPRLTWWMGDSDALYLYSGILNKPSPWTKGIKDLVFRLQDLTNHRFNSVLLNLYRDGNDYMSWHSDNEPELGKMPVIASISLGATRQFKFRKKSRDANEKSISIPLAHGTLLVMDGLTQQHWEHSVPKETRVKSARINLTFRLISK